MEKIKLIDNTSNFSVIQMDLESSIIEQELPLPTEVSDLNSSSDVIEWLQGEVTLSKEVEEEDNIIFKSISNESESNSNHRLTNANTVSSSNQSIRKFRQKYEIVNQFDIINAPKLKPKASDEYIAPFLLCNEDEEAETIYIGEVRKSDTKSEVRVLKNSSFCLYDFSQEANENKLTDNLLNFRKDMANFAAQSKLALPKEAENILSIEAIFDKDNYYSKIKMKHKKKEGRFTKYIPAQKLICKSIRDSNVSRTCLSKSMHFADANKRYRTIFPSTRKNNGKNNGKNNKGLFLLGILEQAANDKKPRPTVM